MAKVRLPGFRCTECGWTSPKWVGRCGECQAWGTVAEVSAPTSASGLKARTDGVAPTRAARPVSQIAEQEVVRSSSGIGEFDRVLGGGLVPGQVVLVAGEPGVGKSTLLLAVGHHVAERLAEPGGTDAGRSASSAASGGTATAGEWDAGVTGGRSTVLYVSGEESVEQIGVRARRIGADSERLLLADENDLATLLGHIEEHDPALIIVDSVQTIASADVEGRAGGVSQVVEVTQVLSRVAKSRRTPMLIVGQSTKDSSIAGPRALEHLVDTVLTFEGDRHTALRLLRAVKNRYGPADEIVCFEQAEDGLREVTDPSDLFREHRDKPVPGVCVTVTMEGRRPMLAEVQSLVTNAATPNPRRGVSGLDAARVSMLIAVTERSVRRPISDKEVYVATVGGAKLSDPACDLAVCLAIASASLDRALHGDVLAIGEVALSGDVRPVPFLAQRVAEARRLGFERILVPRGTRAKLPPDARGALDGARITEVHHLEDAFAMLRHLSVV
ncbi:DNA repair protein RadA [Longivirga aurantiaca]|uniref:DNA repair protein RadA n=1 Tax=Longivirga aurantiaca TaxID=1837743 RepID=A0ABW1SYI7_9ACTN